MKLLLSEYDRGLIHLACSSTPWGGGEEGVTARLLLENGLRLSDLIRERGENFPVDKLSRANLSYKLSSAQVEHLVGILCGGSGALTPAAGRFFAELVERIRRQCPRPSKADNPTLPAGAKRNGL